MLARSHAPRCSGREVVAYVGDVHLPTELPKFLDDAPVIAITSSRRGEITRNGERKMRFIGWRLAHSLDPLSLLIGFRGTSPRQKLPEVSPIFKADRVRLHVSREKGKEIALGRCRMGD